MLCDCHGYKNITSLLNCSINLEHVDFKTSFSDKVRFLFRGRTSCQLQHQSFWFCWHKITYVTDIHISNTLNLILVDLLGLCFKVRGRGLKLLKIALYSARILLICWSQHFFIKSAFLGKNSTFTGSVFSFFRLKVVIRGNLRSIDHASRIWLEDCSKSAKNRKNDNDIIFC